MIFSFPILAVPKGRPRFERGFARTPTKTRIFESLLREMAQMHKGCPSFPLEGPLKVTVKFYFIGPKRPKHSSHITRPDIDNLSKAVCDSLNGIFWNDDSQICVLEAAKFYDKSPQPRDRIEIEVLCLEN